ncbi:MAG: hypothetical protein ACOCVV_11505, partial [Marinobacter sp.]
MNKKIRRPLRNGRASAGVSGANELTLSFYRDISGFDRGEELTFLRAGRARQHSADSRVALTRSGTTKPSPPRLALKAL